MARRNVYICMIDKLLVHMYDRETNRIGLRVRGSQGWSECRRGIYFLAETEQEMYCRQYQQKTY